MHTHIGYIHQQQIRFALLKDDENGEYRVALPGMSQQIVHLPHLRKAGYTFKPVTELPLFVKEHLEELWLAPCEGPAVGGLAVNLEVIDGPLPSVTHIDRAKRSRKKPVLVPKS
jgi:hypothetical protein